MPWTGSAPSQTFQRTDGTRTGADTWKDADNAGVKILSADHDTHDEDLGDGISACLKKDGGNQPTANIAWGSFKITSLGNASADADALNRITGDGRYLLASGGAVETADIADDAVTADKIDDDAVTTAKILDANVTDAKLTAATQALLAQLKKALGLGAGRFEYSSATECLLMPFNGECVSFPAGTVLDIPSAGVAIDTTGLSATTKYFAYAYDNSGSLALEFSTTGHSRDANTGIEIKTGDATRVLVGGVYTNGSSQFADAAAWRGVASWHNRRPRQLNGVFTTDRTFTTTTEVNSEIRCYFFTWGDAVAAQFSGYFSGSTTSNLFSLLSLNGSTNFSTSRPVSGGVSYSPMVSGTFLPSEGGNYITVIAAASSGTGTMSSSVCQITGAVVI